MIAHGVTGSGFKGVISYLATGKDKDNPERVEWTSSRNMATDDLELSASVMRHTANQSVRCKKPVYHLSISWPEGDNIDRELMEKIGDQTLKDLGLEDHQALMVAHNDTDHKHIHMVVNRVHPETGKAWATSKDRKRIMESLRSQEKELGLEYVPNRLTDPELAAEMEPSATRGEGMRAKRKGEDPLKRITPDKVKELSAELKDTFSGSENWQEFDNRLKEKGFEMQPKGRGYILTDGEHYTKFSSLGRQAKRSDIEERFDETRKDYDVEKQIKLENIQEVAARLKKEREDYQFIHGLEDEIER